MIEHNPVIVMTYVTVYCCSRKRICCGSILSFLCQTSRSNSYDQKIPMKTCFTGTHTCTSFKIISPSSGLAKKAFPTEMKCRKCPAKEKGSEEGSKTYWAIFVLSTCLNLRSCNVVHNSKQTIQVK